MVFRGEAWKPCGQKWAGIPVHVWCGGDSDDPPALTLLDMSDDALLICHCLGALIAHLHVAIWGCTHLMHQAAPRYPRLPYQVDQSYKEATQYFTQVVQPHI